MRCLTWLIFCPHSSQRSPPEKERGASKISCRDTLRDPLSGRSWETTEGPEKDEKRRRGHQLLAVPTFGSPRSKLQAWDWVPEATLAWLLCTPAPPRTQGLPVLLPSLCSRKLQGVSSSLVSRSSNKLAERGEEEPGLALRNHLPHPFQGERRWSPGPDPKVSIWLMGKDSWALPRESPRWEGRLTLRAVGTVS